MAERNFSFSIFFTLLGLGIGTALLLTGILTSPQRLQFLYQPRGLGIFFGGIALALFLGIAAPVRQQMLTVLWDIFTDNATPNKMGALQECVMLATRTREAQGQELKLYREIKPYLQHETLRLGLDFLMATYPEALIRETLERHREQRLQMYRQCAEAFQFLGKASIAAGIAAAAIGALRGHLIAPDVLSFYLAGIGLPLALGCIAYAVIFLPLQHKLRYLEEDWGRYEDLNMMGVLLLQGRHHAHYVETTLKAYLPYANPEPVARPVPVAQPERAVPERSAHQMSEYQAESAGPESTIAGASPDFQEALQQEVAPGEPLNRQQLSRFRPIKRNLPPS